MLRRSGWWLPFALVWLHACVPVASPREVDFSLPLHSDAESLTLRLPLRAEAALACRVDCEPLSRVESSYLSCLARCDGARVELGGSCDAAPGDELCFERVVAVPSHEDIPAQQQALSAAGALFALLYVTSHLVAAALCDAYSQDPGCHPDPSPAAPPPGRW